MTRPSRDRIRGFSLGETICLGRLATEVTALSERHDREPSGTDEAHATARATDARHRPPRAHRHA